jgi:hypothetical protein
MKWEKNKKVKRMMAIKIKYKKKMKKWRELKIMALGKLMIAKMCSEDTHIIFKINFNINFNLSIWNKTNLN